MSVTVVVGGQYGSEGKGKVAAYLSVKNKADICVRTGGPNAGHCFEDAQGNVIKLRQIPTGYVNGVSRLLIPAGAVVDVAQLLREMEMLNIPYSRVGIDRNATILTPDDSAYEKEHNMFDLISSTCSGTGAATARRVMRCNAVVASSCHALNDLITNAADEINYAIDANKNVVIEGSQGAGLSLYHSLDFPKATSRDTCASGIISECGISPLAVTNIVLVMRTFPIRVSGKQAGPLENETTWDDISKLSGYNTNMEERTTVTNKVRRVGHFEYTRAAYAIKINRPTEIALNFIDYIDCSNRGLQYLTKASACFIETLRKNGVSNIRYIGTGPRIDDMVEMR